MQTSLWHILAVLLVGIVLIILLTTRYKVHAFFALIASSLVVGLGVHLSLEEVLVATQEGFGNIMKSLGLIIILGTTLGVILEHTGGTQVMASYILRKVGEARSAMAMNITGFVIGLPIFCDSGYIVLSGLNNSLVKRTGIPMATMAASLATGLYAVHCLIPPHPGAAASAGIIGADFGQLILIGILIAVPTSAVGYCWAQYAGKKDLVVVEEKGVVTEDDGYRPSVIKAFLPVIVPILLISVKSFVVVEGVLGNEFLPVFLTLGDPVIALAIGVALALNCGRSWNKNTLSALLQDSAEKAGGILVIIGAGGAFGAVLGAIKIGDHLSTSLTLDTIGIFFPFLLTFILKTAQGSSTVAIITAASIVQPLLPVLGLDTDTGRLLCVLAMGSGSMMISHANDAYFWVISKFSGLGMKSMLKVYSVATILMGLTSFFIVYILSRIIQ